MDVIVGGALAGAALLGLIGAGSAFLKWLSVRGRYSLGSDRIPLAFPVDGRDDDDEDPGSGGQPVGPLAGARQEVAVSEISRRAAPVAEAPPTSSEWPAREAGFEFEELASVPVGVESGNGPLPASVREALEPLPTPRGITVVGPRGLEGAAPKPARSTEPMLPADSYSLVEGRTIRFHVPAGTLRLLPGRLVVEEGEDNRAEIRFVDLPGSAPEVTFGRKPGQPLRHVQLRSPTVSREHARLVREGDEWVITNLSRTNPIVINGERIIDPADRRVLGDSDRIEMGEVIFRFHRS